MDFVQIVNWIGANWALITVLAFGLVVLILALSDWLKMNSQLKELFLMAEKALAKHLIKNGPDAMEAVVFALYNITPLRVRLALQIVAKAAGTTDQEVLGQVAQWVYDRIKLQYEERQSVLALRDSRPWCTWVKRKL